MLAALSGCSSSGTGSSSGTPTTTWVSHAYLASSFTTDLATETTANKSYVTALSAATSGITSQEQKLTLDNNTIQRIGFGQDCNAADTSTYSSCVASEDQTAAYARSDAASVEAAVQADFQRYASRPVGTSRRSAPSSPRCSGCRGPAGTPRTSTRRSALRGHSEGTSLCKRPCWRQRLSPASPRSTPGRSSTAGTSLPPPERSTGHCCTGHLGVLGGRHRTGWLPVVRQRMSQGSG